MRHMEVTVEACDQDEISEHDSETSTVLFPGRISVQILNWNQVSSVCRIEFVLQIYY